MKVTTIGLALVVGVIIGFVAYPVIMDRKSNFKG
jgi:hypothetical protein